jgi:hypothetical protein
LQQNFWDPFSNFFNMINVMFIIIPIIFVVVFVVIVVTVCRTGTRVAGNVARGFTLEAPSFVIPERYRGRTRSDGSQMTTVRLPEKCPTCGAAISQEGIDWVGPLEAKCNYCGSTVRATFESV